MAIHPSRTAASASSEASWDWVRPVACRIPPHTRLGEPELARDTAKDRPQARPSQARGARDQARGARGSSPSRRKMADNTPDTSSQARRPLLPVPPSGQIQWREDRASGSWVTLAQWLYG